ncbi:MAG: Hsp33 family molecular chaperone [Methylobacteriaceae bacterium]|nr:Hsp33 family molecular chaperone [Methylobacteriaceae bacterium]
MSEEGPARFVSDEGRDDTVTPFAVEPLDLRGRLVRLGPSIDAIIRRHGYPDPVSRLIGEAAALTMLLASALKFDGRFQLQTRTDGAVDLLVVDVDAPDRLRAFARFDAARVAAGEALLGQGQFGLTIDPGGDMARYQGLVAMRGQSLEEAAHEYFRQSEQIPTFIRLAVAEAVIGGRAQWRAGGLLAQFLPDAPARRQRDQHPGDAPAGAQVVVQPEDEAWLEAKALAGTIEAHELVDPTLSGERLLYRLFHERGVKVFAPQPVIEKCRCSNERVEAMLRGFTPQDRRDMVGDDGRIAVTCEFCSTLRVYDPAEFDAP